MIEKIAVFNIFSRQADAITKMNIEVDKYYVFINNVHLIREKLKQLVSVLVAGAKAPILISDRFCAYYNGHNQEFEITKEEAVKMVIGSPRPQFNLFRVVGL